MAKKEELLGKYDLGLLQDEHQELTLTQEELEFLEKNQQALQREEMLKRLEAEKFRKEKCENAAIIPYGFNLIVKPYADNPYMEKQSASGLLIDNKTYHSLDTGVSEEHAVGIQMGYVVEVGPKVTDAKRGDDILYMNQREIPVPFMNSGFRLLPEGAIMCVVNKDDILKSRFKYLND